MNNMKLRVCLTDECNFDCEYCRAGGEAGFTSNNQLSSEDLVKLLVKLNKCGFEALRFTGGEPLLRKDWYEIVRTISDMNIYKKITMVTNGSLLDRDNNIEKISNAGFKSVTVSLDSTNNKNFCAITNRDCLDKVVSNIIKLKRAGVNVKINSVISKRNEQDVEALIDFCVENRINLKLLDLVGMDSEYWRKEYVDLKKVEEFLKTKCDDSYTQYQDEGFGTPEHVYKYKGIEIIVKDSTLGTCYMDSCKKCQKYPCQSGIVSMIMSHDGFIKVCSLNDRDFVDAKRMLYDENFINDIKELMTLYNNSSFCEKMWNEKVG